MAIPQTMLAAVTSQLGEGRGTSARQIPVPQIEPHQVLIKVRTAAGNPIDFRRVDIDPNDGVGVGIDFAGTVVKVGTGASAGRFTVGDTVAGIVHGHAQPSGAYAEYVAANADILLPIPDSWSFDQAAQEGTSLYTTSLCLYHILKLPSPLDRRSSSNEQIEVLIWGGATSVGQAAIQLAHLAGLRVITTASPANFELVRKFGADIVLDYKDEATPSNIKALTQGKLRYAVDCISEKRTMQQIGACFGSNGGKIAVMLPPHEDVQKLKNVEIQFILTFHLLGKDLTVPVLSKLDKAQYDHRVDANKILTHVLLSGEYQPGPVEVLPNGLDGVNTYLERARKGEVRGAKLVSRIAETPQLKAGKC